MKKIQIWLMAIRVKTLFASIGPFLMALGFSINYHYIIDNESLSPFIFHSFLLLISVIISQISANLINDFYDSKNGVDNAKRLGPTRVTQHKYLSKHEMYLGICLSLLIPLIIGFYFAIVIHWFFLVVTVVSLLASYLYTAGPFPISYYGLGDVMAFVFFGPVMVNSIFFALTEKFLFTVFLYSIIPGFFAAMLMGINNFRDLENDLENAKFTPAVLFGKNFSKWEYVVLSVLVCILPGIISLTCLYKSIHFNYPLFSIISIFFFLFFLPCIQTLWKEKIEHFNKTLYFTSILLFAYHLIFFFVVTIKSSSLLVD